MDGCSQIKILFKIILPLSLPGIVTVGLFYAVAQWNSYFPAIYIYGIVPWCLCRLFFVIS
ncbi:MAG: hypothetical protein ACLUOI_20510 [Eisenbergiella sp.]